jgi:hypothetical protein
MLNTVNTLFFCYVIKNILVNYKENPLYRIFLYPVIKEKTINKIYDDFLFCSLVLDYLKNICKDIVNLLKWLNNEGKMVASSDGYFMNQVFFWDAATKENDNKGVKMKVRFFLRDILGWENTEQLKINVKNYENLIEIYDISNSLRNSSISIPENGGKAVFRQNGNRIYEFVVMEHTGFLSIEVKTNKKPIDKIIFPFLERHNVHLIDFLTQVRTRLIKSTSVYENSTFEALLTDPNYKKALEWLDKELDLR